MAFGISTRHLNRVHSFASAQALWDKTPKWPASRANNIRALAKRTDYNKILMQRPDGSFECILHRTPVTTYHPDGSVTLRVYDSVSTREFASCTAPRGCSPVSHHGDMWWSVQTDDGEKFYRPRKGALKLAPTIKGNWELRDSDLVSYTNRACDLKLAAQARKLLKPYADWYALTLRLGVDLPRYTGYFYGRAQPLPQEVIQQLADPERYLEVLEVYGPPKVIRERLYWSLGAYYNTPVPAGELPKRS